MEAKGKKREVKGWGERRGRRETRDGKGGKRS